MLETNLKFYFTRVRAENLVHYMMARITTDEELYALFRELQKPDETKEPKIVVELHTRHKKTTTADHLAEMKRSMRENFGKQLTPEQIDEAVAVLVKALQTNYEKKVKEA